MLKINSEERTVEAKIARAVAGFDLPFSAPNSVSVSLALVDRGTQAAISAAHQQSLAYVVYAKQCLFTSRSARTARSRRRFVGWSERPSTTGTHVP